MDQYRAGLEDTDGGLAAAVHQRRNLGVRIYAHETRTELIALANVDEPGVVLRPA